jgi:hypothetical protein
MTIGWQSVRGSQCIRTKMSPGNLYRLTTVLDQRSSVWLRRLTLRSFGEQVALPELWAYPVLQLTTSRIIALVTSSRSIPTTHQQNEQMVELIIRYNLPLHRRLRSPLFTLRF